jgi:dUTP pyrophosphatase
MEVKIHAVNPDAIPAYHSAGAAGADLVASLATPILLLPGKRALVPTGISIELPLGYEAQVRPRSGLAVKNGITCLNSPGTIDSDYRGELKVLLINLGDDPFEIRNGDRIAQLVVAQVARASFVASDLAATERGSNGFGSTGT